MRTALPDELLGTREGARANEILRSCVHCGFCNATCPTYQVTGDELDGPRGRIYLIKEMLETETVEPVVTRHLDRCLTCRACETTCPSGVEYGELVELARDVIGDARLRSSSERVMRAWFRRVLPDPQRLRRWATLGRWFRWLLPLHLASALPRKASAPDYPDAASALIGENADAGDAPTVIVLQGCVQSASTPATTAALMDLLERNGVRGVVAAGEVCCGSLDLHLGDVEAAREYARRNINALYPMLHRADAVLSSASGCGVTFKDYARLLADDPVYAAMAERLVASVRDVAEYCADLEVTSRDEYRRVAWHAPCTLQHGQRVTGRVEALLIRAGYDLTAVSDPHLCCGSAGTYSYLHKDMADELRARKLAGLTGDQPDVIATANVGCQMHLAQRGGVPVLHWLELV